MSRLPDLAERIDRLVLRHKELARTNALLEQQVAGLQGERDSLRSRLSAARARIDALLERLPLVPPDAGEAEPGPATPAAGGAQNGDAAQAQE